MLKKLTLFDYINTVVMLIIFAVIVFPILNIIAISFSDTLHIAQNKVTFFPIGFNIEAYRMILKDDRVLHAYMNTVIYTVIGASINLLLTAVSAYPLSKGYFFGKKAFMIMIIITMFFSGGMIPTYILVKSLNMIDTIWALIIPNAIWTIELLIQKSFYESLSPSLYESAIIDGASEYKIMFKIYIPLSKAALASLALFFFMGHWNSFFIPMIYLNDIQKMPLQVVLKDMLINGNAKESNLVVNSNLTPEAMKNATIFISMIPVLMLYPFAQKYFVNGIMLGAVKG